MSEIRSISVVVKQVAEHFAPNLTLLVQGAPVEREGNSRLHVFQRVDDKGDVHDNAVHVVTHDNGELDVHVQAETPHLAGYYKTHLSQYLPEFFAFA
jgi:GrpB-like predicted nucleotidyltransferase (UPF0157 family)